MADLPLDILVRAQGAQQAAAQVNALDKSVSRLSKSGKTNIGGSLGSSLSRGVSVAQKDLGRLGDAVGHVKGRIGGLASSMGPLLGFGGLLGLTSLLGTSITEASNFGANVDKVAKVTNLATGTASAMVDTLDKWGVSADRLIPMVGKLEKNVGLLAATSEKASAFQKEYGFSLLGSNGKIADANTLLLRSADYFNSHASATNKAIVMSRLWGKSWQDMVPILAKGSEFIKAQEADSIHLTDRQLANIAKFRGAQRDFADAFGDLQVKIGAELMPALSGGLSAASAWFDTHADEIAGFFRDASRFAGDAAQQAMGVFSAVRAGWDSIPAPVRDLLVKGVVADRTIHFLFGMSPISFATGALEKAVGGLAGGFFQRGGTPANPLFVADVAGGLGKAGGAVGAAENAAGGVSGLVKAARFVVPMVIGAAAIWEGYLAILGSKVGDTGLGGGKTGVNNQGGPALTPAQQGAQFSPNRTGGASNAPLGEHALDRQVDADNKANAILGAGLTQGHRDMDKLDGRLFGIKSSVASLHTPLDALHVDFNKNIAAVKASSDPMRSAKAIGNTVRDLLKGVGNVKTTSSVVAELQRLRAIAVKNGDKADVRILDRDIKVATAKLDTRRLVAAQLTKADRIIHSSEATRTKIRELEGVERSIGGRSHAATARVEAAIHRLKLTSNVAVSVSTVVSARAAKASETRIRIAGGKYIS